MKTFDRIKKEIDGDLDRLFILHDMQRWPKLPIVEEIDGFRIVLASYAELPEISDD